ncbi:MAG TPA: beta-propeller domain-containing protein, partial [Polyangiales bacterium]|nr:beta-propeller domain-containing protein [Polyangiales bacterium]
MGIRAKWSAVAVAGALLGGCVSSNDGNSGDEPGGKRDDGVNAAVQAVAALQRADSCDDLLARIQDDVVTKISLQAELMRDPATAAKSGGGLTRGPGGFNGGVGVAVPGVSQPPPSASPTTPSTGVPGSAEPDRSAGNPSSGPAAMQPAGAEGQPDSPAEQTGTLGPQDHSETNTQVEGVDEADIVKTDGTHIYVLHGNKLVVLDSWPADATAMKSSIAIEGRTTEMFVKDGVAAVFSQVTDQGDLLEQPEVDPATGNSKGPGYYYGAPFTKITLVDVSGATPVVQRQLLIEGSYLSARLHGSTVRAVIEGGFRTPPLYGTTVEYVDPWGRQYDDEQIDLQVNAWRDRMIAAVTNTKLSDWLPIEREIIEGKLSEPSPRCTDFYAPSPGLASYGLTNVVSFDLLDDPKHALGGAIVLGYADEVYANDHALVLAARDYRFDQGFIQKERTVLHMFSLDGAATSYQASGAVPGHIVDQFSIDEREGVLRVSTSARLWQNFVPPVPRLAEAVASEDDDDVATLSRTTDNRVLTLREKDGALVRVGATEPLGKDGEMIVSTRFLGDVGYVVTFRQTDPLIAVDLSDPAAPTVLGELEIPGFSDYMHPLGPDHLLTIGRDASTTGQVQGLMLQIFDVSDPAAPRRTHTWRFADGGYSEANVNHKAFTFHTPAGTAEGTGLLAFPYVSYSGNAGSSLELFDVSASDGFNKLGSISHTTMLQNLCIAANGGAVPVNMGGIDPGFAQPAYFSCVPPEVRRGVFIFGNEGDFVYSISHGGVLVHDIADLQTPVASVALPYPDFSENRTYYGSAGGSSTMPGATIGSTPASPPTLPTTPPPAETPKPQG